MVEEQQFYQHFNIQPIMLVDCSYYNEFNYGIFYGDDVCEHAEQQTEDYSCEKCDKTKNKEEWYPPITDDVLLRLLLMCPQLQLDATKIQLMSNNELKSSIMKHIIEHIDENNELFNVCTIILNVHKADMLAW